MNAERLLKALANRRRLAILDLLNTKEELSVAEIAGAIKLSFKATSKHLLILSHVDLVERRQVSLNILYRLAKPLSPLLRTVFTLL